MTYCLCSHGHHVYPEGKARIVQCDECKATFDDPNNTGNLPLHEETS